MAHVNGIPIPAGAVEARAEEHGESARDALSALVNEELMVQEAERRGLHTDPEVVHAAKQTAVYRLLRESFDKSHTPGAVGDDYLRRLYRANRRTRFQRPELRRFSHIFVDRPWRRRGRSWVLDAKEDARRRALMAVLKEHVESSRPATWRAFETLAAHISGHGFEVRTQRGTLPKDELRKPFADALWSLSGPGRTTGVIATKRWYHVAFLVEIRPATNISFQEARPEILEKFFPRYRKQAFVKLLRSLEDRCGVKRYPENLQVAPARGNPPSGEHPSAPAKARQ